MALDYGYTIQIQSNGTSDPSSTPANQWQRKLKGQSGFVDLPGEEGTTYTIGFADSESKIRLKQNFGGSNAYSNELEVSLISRTSEIQVISGKVVFNGTASNSTTITGPSGFSQYISGSFTATFTTPGEYSLDASKLTKINFYGTSNTADFTFSPGFDTRNVVNMAELFRGCGSSSTDVSNWDTSNVTNLTYAFAHSKFNGDLSNWDTSKVTNLAYTFLHTSFNNNSLGDWDVGNVTNLRSTFHGDSKFTGDVSKWNVSKVTNMHNFALDNPHFDSELNDWDVGNVTYMLGVFGGSSIPGKARFNRDIGNWNVANVTRMEWMFYGNSAFNQDLSRWCVSYFRTAPSTFEGGCTAWTNPNWRPVWGTCP